MHKTLRRGLKQARAERDALMERESVLRAQQGRHRSLGESGDVIAQEMAETRRALYHARREVAFQERLEEKRSARS